MRIYKRKLITELFLSRWICSCCSDARRRSRWHISPLAT